jgi:hypothetical protein
MPVSSAGRSVGSMVERVRVVSESTDPPPISRVAPA